MFFINHRIIDEALYIVNNNATIRQTAKFFNIGKSTVHKDIKGRLKDIDEELYYRVKEILNNNLKNRHIRGGEVTKKKFRLMRK